MRTRTRTAAVMLLSAGALVLGTGAAVAEEPGGSASGGTSSGQGFEPGPDHTDFEPGPDHGDFEPGPDYENFQPGPDYGNFEPGANPGTADLVDDNAARVLGSVFRGLFG